jgi:hypothetical protein
VVHDAPQRFLTPIDFVREMTMAIFRPPDFVRLQTAIDRRQNMEAVDSAGSKSLLVFNSPSFIPVLFSSRIYSDPNVSSTAVAMMLWGLKHRFIQKWTCASVEHLL